MKTCNKCKWCVLLDYGYSNYTQEGTYVHCAKKLHPEDGFDRFYGEDDRLKYAEKCAGYEVGSAVDMDVDRENVRDLTEEELAIYKMVEGEL